MRIAAIPVGRQNVTVHANWDREAGVWVATGQNIGGLVVEADTWPTLVEEIELVVPELLEVMSATGEGVVAGLVPATPNFEAQCRIDRGGRDKPGHDGGGSAST